MMIRPSSSRNDGLTRSFKYRLMAYAAAGLSVLVLSAPATADFLGDYVVGNWTTTITPDLPDNSGSVDTSSAPAAITVNGSDICDEDFGCGLADVDFTIKALNAGTVSFKWLFDSDDCCGFDSGGWLLNGAYTVLADTIVTPQNGTAGFAVAVDDVFGFRVRAADNFAGPAFLTISCFEVNGGTAPCDVNPAPEPGMLALLAAGMLGAVSVMRRSRRRETHTTVN